MMRECALFFPRVDPRAQWESLAIPSLISSHCAGTRARPTFGLLFALGSGSRAWSPCEIMSELQSNGSHSLRSNGIGICIRDGIELELALARSRGSVLVGR